MTASAQNITVIAAGAPFTYGSRNKAGNPVFVVAVPGEDYRSTTSMIFEPIDAVDVYNGLREWFRSDEVAEWIAREEAKLSEGEGDEE